MSRMSVREKDRTDYTANDSGSAKEMRKNTDNGEEYADGPPVNGQTYRKELTVCVEIIGEDRITMMELLRGIKEACGNVIGCRFKTPTKYEVTMSREEGKQKLMDGFKIKNTRIMAKEIVNDELIVSFMNLPVYIEDAEILEKLALWEVKAISAIKRRKWPGTNIVDGTRFVKVKFTEQVRSLPYSTRFNTLEGAEFFRVIHDKQVRVCRVCIQPGHVIRECPDFLCRKCGKQGHYARECAASVCLECRRERTECICREEEDLEAREESEDMEQSGEEGEEMPSQGESDDGESEQQQHPQTEATPEERSSGLIHSQRSGMSSTLDDVHPEDFRSQERSPGEERRTEDEDASVTSLSGRTETPGDLGTAHMGVKDTAVSASTSFSSHSKGMADREENRTSEDSVDEVSQALVDKWKRTRDTKTTTKKRMIGKKKKL